MSTRLLVVLLLALGATLSCFSDRNGVVEPIGGECSIPASAFGRDRAVVIIRGFQFLPDTVRVRRGTTVTWVNCENPGVDPHTSTSTTNAWDSGTLVPGANYEHAFAGTGAFPYFCRPHPGMRGAVIVE